MHDVINACSSLQQILCGYIIEVIQILRNSFSTLSVDESYLLKKLEKKTCLNLFEGLTTEYSQINYLKSEGLLIEPTEYTVGC